MQRITPSLWFDKQAEEAMNFYVPVFSNSKVLYVHRYGPEGSKVSGRPQGTVMTARFLLDKLLGDPDPVKSERVMRAMLQGL